MSRRTTLGDVASLAGVSPATASKVLNDRGGFSEGTRARVERAIEELGYTPSTAGRDRRIRSLVVVFDSLQAIYSLRVLEGMVDGARIAGVDLVTRVAEPLAADPVDVRAIAASGHSGVVMVTSTIGPELVRRFREHGLPLVSVDASASLQDDVPDVSSTHWRGGMQAAAHLLELGHRRIAFIGGDARNPGLRERLAGFLDQLSREGVPADPSLVSQDGLASGEQQLAAMLASAHPPTAVFASTDGGAVTAIAVAREAGLAVPDDLSVIGYDDTYASLSPALGLTTVRAPLHDLGRTAVDTVLALAHGRGRPTGDLRLPTRLVVRSTTGPAPVSAQASGIDQK